MSTYSNTVDVEVPVRVAYDQWTQFEEFPRFMSGVERVDQLDERRTHWVVSVNGVNREFDAVVTEQEPDRRVAWNSTDGQEQGGVVSFEPLSERKTRVTLEMAYEPQGFVENAGDKLGLIEHRMKGDLDRFKEFIELRDTPTGAWRGTIERPSDATPLP